VQPTLKVGIIVARAFEDSFR